MDDWRQLLREAAFDVHESTYGQDEDVYTVFTCVKPIC